MLGGSCSAPGSPGPPGPAGPTEAAVIRYAIGTGATQDSVTLLPAGAVVLNAILEEQTPYSLGATIQIGQAGSLSLLQATTDNNPQVTALYSVPQVTSWGGVARVVRTTVGGAPVAGAGFVTVVYAIPNP